MGYETLGRPTDGPADRLARDHGAMSVSSFVVAARRRGVDPSPLLDTDFFLRGAEPFPTGGVGVGD